MEKEIMHFIQLLPFKLTVVIRVWETHLTRELFSNFQKKTLSLQLKLKTIKKWCMRLPLIKRNFWHQHLVIKSYPSAWPLWMKANPNIRGIKILQNLSWPLNPQKLQVQVKNSNFPWWRKVSTASLMRRGTRVRFPLMVFDKLLHHSN